MRYLARLVALSLCAVPVAAAQEPTLAELAAKQKKARKGQVRVVSDEDLKAARGGYVPAEVTGQAAPSATPAEGEAKPAEAQEKSDEEVRATRKAEIEKTIQREQGIIADAQRIIADAQRELGDLTNYTMGGRRAALQKAIDDANAEIAKAQQIVADLEDQARRAGIAVGR